MNEDYAGTWYTDYPDDPSWGPGFYIYSMTDTSFSISIYFYSLGWPIEVGKGKLTKLSEATVEYLLTHEYDQSTNSLVESGSDPRTVSFSLASDGQTLVFDAKTFTADDPRL